MADRSRPACSISASTSPTTSTTLHSRKQPQINGAARAKVRADKEREVTDGFDGTWVAHPDLVPTAREVFSQHLGSAPHQKSRLREDVVPNAAALRDTHVPGGTTTEAGVRNDISVALQYLAACACRA